MEERIKKQIRKGVLCPEHKKPMTKLSLKNWNVLKCPCGDCWSVDYLKELGVLK